MSWRAAIADQSALLNCLVRKEAEPPVAGRLGRWVKPVSLGLDKRLHQSGLGGSRAVSLVAHAAEINFKGQMPGTEIRMPFGMLERGRPPDDFGRVFVLWCRRFRELQLCQACGFGRSLGQRLVVPPVRGSFQAPCHARFTAATCPAPSGSCAATKATSAPRRCAPGLQAGTAWLPFGRRYLGAQSINLGLQLRWFSPVCLQGNRSASGQIRHRSLDTRLTCLLSVLPTRRLWLPG